MPRIQLRVSEQQKEAWEQYADEHPNCRSVSELIRLAVTREMSDEPQGTTEITGLDDLTRTVEKMDGDVEELIHQISAFTRLLGTSVPMTDPAADETDVSAFVSELREGRENAQAVEDKSLRMALRELSEDISSIRETDDGEFYIGSEDE
jgi:phage shock protein A